MLLPGMKVMGGWTVGAVLLTGGERYYLLSRGNNETAMWPAFMVEDGKGGTA